MKRIFLLSLPLLMLLILIAGGTPIAAAQNQDGAPSAGPAGTTFTFHTGTTFTFKASGFSANERVGYWLNPPAGAVVMIDDLKHHVNSDGQFSIGWMAPAAIAPGTWQLVAQGTESGVLQVISFQIQ